MEYKGKDFMEILLSNDIPTTRIPAFIIGLLNTLYRTELNIAGTFPTIDSICSQSGELRSSLFGWFARNRYEYNDINLKNLSEMLKNLFTQADGFACNKIIDTAKSLLDCFPIPGKELVGEPNHFTVEFFKHIIQTYHTNMVQYIINNMKPHDADQDMKPHDEDQKMKHTICHIVYFVR
jgi:hypothetical protein